MTQRTFSLEFMEFLNKEKGIAQDNQTDAGFRVGKLEFHDKDEWLYQSGKLALIEDLEMKIQQLIIQNNNKRSI